MDLNTCESGVPPGVEVMIVLSKNKDKIMIHSFDGTTHNTAVTASPDYKVGNFKDI